MTLIRLVISGAERLRLHFSNFSAFTAIQAASYLIPLVTIPYFARVLTISGMGQLAIANAIGLAGGVVMDYGVLQSGTRFSARHADDRMVINRYLVTSSALKGILFLGLLAALVLASFVVPQVHDHFWIYWWAMLSAATACLFPLWLFQGLLMVPKAAKLLVATRFLAAGGALLLVRSPADTYVVPMMQAIAGLIALALAALLLKRAMSFCMTGTTTGDITSLLHDNWKLFSATAWGILHTYGSIVIIGAMLPAQSVGFYSIAEKISQAFVSFFNIAAQTAFPTIVRRFSSSNKNFPKIIRLYLALVTSAAAIMLTMMFLARQYIYSFFAGQQSSSGLAVFSIWLFASFFTVICVSLTPVMVAMHRDVSLARIYRFTGVTFLIGAPVLVHSFGVVGMAMAALYPQCFMALYLLYTVKRGLRHPAVPPIAGHAA